MENYYPARIKNIKLDTGTTVTLEPIILSSTIELPRILSTFPYHGMRDVPIKPVMNIYLQFDRKMNPVNYFAGLYSKVVNKEFRVYFKDYRDMVH